MQDDRTNRGSSHGNPILRFFSGARNDRHQPALDDFVAYWKGKCRGGEVPRRSEIDPRGIEPLLTNAVVCERIAPGLARLRIAGTHLSDLLGMEVRGLPLSALFEPSDRDALAQHLVRLFDQPAWLRLNLSAQGGLLTPSLKGTMLLLPLRSDLGDISRALGCLVTEGGPGHAPRRLRIDGCSIVPVAGTPAVVASPLSAPGRVAAGPAPLRPAPSVPATRAERPYLRLVHTETV